MPKRVSPSNESNSDVVVTTNTADANPKKPPGFLRNLSNAAAVIIGGIGIATLAATGDAERALQEKDAVFGVSNSTLLLMVGLVHLSLSVFIFVVQDLTSRALLILWIVLIHATYYFGMNWGTEKSAFFPVLNLVGWKWGVSPNALGIAWKLVIVYLLMFGFLVLALEWHWMKQQKRAHFEKSWRETRHQHGKTTTSSEKQTEMPSQESAAKSSGIIHRDNKPEVITANSELEFKFSCTNCGQHIQCNTRYSGRQIACPACQSRIVVPQSA